MPKKMRRMRTFARTASKSMEKKLVENAKELMGDPYKALPYYEDDYSTRYFGKIKKTFDKVKKFKDDTKKLEKLSNKKDLSGALAGTLLLAHSEKAPYLGVLKYSTGEITYAQRGKADKEKQAGLQHFDDPVLRLLCFKNIALKKNIHLYSWDNGFVSTGLKANPPKEFIKFILDRLNLKNKDNVLVCNHLKAEKVKEKQNVDENYLRIHWKSADLIIGFCENCSKLRKNTLFDVSKYMIESDVSKDFGLDVIGQAVKDAKTLPSQDTIFTREYLSGEVSDYEFIKKNMKKRHQDIKESKERIFVLNGKSYEDDLTEFIDALKPNEYERKGLELILEKIEEPVVFDDVTPNKVLEKYWKDNGLNALKEMVSNEEMANKFFSLNDSPSEILELVFNYNKRQKILSQLPTYTSLPPLASFIDNIARTYKTFGEKEALAEIKKRPDTPKGKSIAYAFLLVFDKAKDKKWQFSPIEIEYGEFLKEHVKKLIDSEPKKYHNCLQELLASSGSSEKI